MHWIRDRASSLILVHVPLLERFPVDRAIQSLSFGSTAEAPVRSGSPRITGLRDTTRSSTVTRSALRASNPDVLTSSVEQLNPMLTEGSLSQPERVQPEEDTIERKLTLIDEEPS